MRKLLLSVACFALLLLAQTESSPLNAAEELNYCPPNYCNELKAECTQDCYPCLGVTACYYYICDAFCSCQC